MKKHALALLVFLAATLVMTNPLILHLFSAVEDRQDALLNTWIIAWVGHALVADPAHLFDANIFYPYTRTLAFSEILIPQGLLALPFNLALANPILGYNLVVLGAFLLDAFGMYLLVFDLTKNRAAGILAGLIFAFNPYNLGNLAQVQLLWLGWLPLAILALRRLLDRTGGLGGCPPSPLLPSPLLPSPNEKGVGGEGKGAALSNALLLAIFLSLQILSSFYYALFSALALTLYLLWFVADRWIARRKIFFPIPRPWHLLFALALTALIVTPFILPYLQVQREYGLERKIEASEPFSASLKQYTEVAPQNVLYGKFLAPRPPIYVGGYPLDNLFPGIIAVVLGVLGLARNKNTREKYFYALLIAIAFVLSLGPRLYLAAHVPTNIPLPYGWLYDALPLLHALRAPVRFDALVMLGLAVLAGMGIQVTSEKEKAKSQNDDAPHFTFSASHLLSRVTRHPSPAIRLSSFVTRHSSLVLGTLILLEYFAFPAAQVAPVPVGTSVAPVYRWLAQQPRTVILELPLIGTTEPLDLTTQYLSTHHWHPTPDGYSGFIAPRRGDFGYEMQFFPNERAVSLLQALDVEYVVVHPAQIDDWDQLQPALEREGEFTLVQQFEDDYVYLLAPREQDAAQLTTTAYFPNPGAVGAPYTVFLIVQNRGLRSFAAKPTDAVDLIARWSGNGPVFEHRASVPIPLVTSTASVIPVVIRAPASFGNYRLSLRAEASAIGAVDLSGEVSVAKTGASQVVLPARVTLDRALAPSYAAGENVRVDVLWRPLNKINAYYSASVRIVDTGGNKIVAQDREPRVPTLLWTPGVVVADWFDLPLPRDVPPGEYRVEVLMYTDAGETSALLLDENLAPEETTVLGELEVK